MKQFYFYKTTNLLNGKFYYGSGSQENYLGSGSVLNKAFESHGRDNFKIEKLRFFDTREQAFAFEDRFLKFYNIAKMKESYNICNNAFGGDVFTNHPNKDLYRKRMSESSKERMKDPKERAKCNSFANLSPKELEKRKKVWSKASMGKLNGRYVHNKPVEVTNIETNEIQIFEDAVTTYKALDLNRKVVYQRLKDKSSKPHRGYTFQWID